jgi:phage-related protein
MAKNKRTKNDTISINTNLKVDFYQSNSGREPVREWIRQLTPTSRARLGRDLRRLQAGWPVGMPLVRKLDKGLWELRSKFPHGIGRLLFTVEKQRLVFLGGFMKKSRKLPVSELNIAKHRLAKLRKGWRK